MATKGTIEFEHISKRYRLGTLGTLRGAVSALLSRGDNSSDGQRVMWALRDVTFQAAPGESLGLIGPNGAGKTTALKLLSNITKPTAGRIAVHGRVSSLIELGAGFHPELTGLENIYLNGAILGLKRHEIRRKLDAIVAFSELERFLDTPVKRYSSGMYVRLAFAVSAHTEPDVLLVDEVLAVGDASFRHRCIQHMRELQRNGTTVVFVSHNMHLLRDMCDSVLLLMNGQIQAKGAPSDVIPEYERLLLSTDSLGAPQEERGQPVFHSQGRLTLTDVEVLSPAHGTDHRLASHLPARVIIHYRAASPQPIGRIDVRMVRDDGALCSAIDHCAAGDAGLELREISGNGVIEITYNPLQLTTGRYSIIVRITDPSDSLVIASGQSRPFQVYDTRTFRKPGIYVPVASWANHETGA